MTMAHNSDNSPPELSRTTVDGVETALATYVEGPQRDAEPLRAALALLAREARSLQIPPEQLLVTLKDIWYTMPRIKDARDPDEHGRLLQRAVTMCIKEYYQS